MYAVLELEAEGRVVDDLIRRLPQRSRMTLDAPEGVLRALLNDEQA